METIRIAPHSNRETFSESWQAIEDGEPLNLTGASIVFSVRDKVSDEEVLSGTTSGGEITITTTTVTVDFTADDMSGLDPKEYNVGMTIELLSSTTQFFVGTLQIVDGVVP